MKTKISTIFFHVLQHKPGEHLWDGILSVLNWEGASLTLSQMEFFNAVFIRGSLFNVLAQAPEGVLIVGCLMEIWTRWCCVFNELEILEPPLYNQKKESKE